MYNKAKPLLSLFYNGVFDLEPHLYVYKDNDTDRIQPIGVKGMMDTKIDSHYDFEKDPGNYKTNFPVETMKCHAALQESQKVGQGRKRKTRRRKIINKKLSKNKKLIKKTSRR